MVSALFDTNILVDFLNAVPEAREELSRYDEKAISVITWIEVMVGANPDVEDATRRFLEGFTVVPLWGNVAERAIALRRQHRIKLPGAIIWASADIRSMILVTRNTKDFPPQTPGVRVPYSL